MEANKMATIHIIPVPALFSRNNHRQSSWKLLTHLFCGVALLMHLPAADAASASGKLSVSARVVTACQISTNPRDFSSLGPYLSRGIASHATGTALSINCGKASDRPRTMAITTESSKAGKPFIEVFSDGTPKDRGHEPDRIIHGTTNPDAKIIQWGLFPVDAHLVISIPQHDRAGEPVLSDGDAQTLKLIIDF